MITVAEVADQIFGLLARRTIRDFLTELIALAKFLTCDPHDVFRMAVVLAKINVFGTISRLATSP